MSREVYIKSLNKEQKLDLLESGEWRDKLGQWGLAGLKVRDSEGISKND
jgi:hypothetical protein